MKVERIFKKQPPDELILRFLQVLGIKGFDDAHWWPRTLIQSVAEELDALLPELEPYYMKHKRHHVTRKQNTTSYLAILRHLISVRNLEVENKYTSKAGSQFTTFHRIQNPNPRFQSEEDFVISFS